MACGWLEMPFWTFLGATVLGKGFTKVTIQCMVCITVTLSLLLTLLLLLLLLLTLTLTPQAYEVVARVLSRVAPARARAHAAPAHAIGRRA